MGGHAFKTTVKINQENIQATTQDVLKKISDIFGLSTVDVKVIGSSPKKDVGETAGDIDVALTISSLCSIQNCSENEVFEMVGKKLDLISKETRNISMYGVYSMVWPIKNIDGKQEALFVQVDLMLVSSMEWAEWAYSPLSARETMFEGVYRNEILSVIATQINTRELQSANSNVRVSRKIYFDIAMGLMEGTEIETRAETSDGKKSREIELINKRLISNNPDEVVKIIFGEYVGYRDLKNWELTYEALLDPRFKFKKNLESIIKKLRLSVWRMLKRKGDENWIETSKLIFGDGLK